MLDIGWSEMAMIALIALIVIGPKDLPRVMRSVGQWTRKARKMARDFQNSLDDMIEDEELREAKDSVKTATQRFNKRDPFNIGGSLEKHVDPDGSLREHASAIDSEARKTEREVNAADAGHAPSDGDGGPSGRIAAPDVSDSGASGTPADESGGSGGVTFVQRETPVAPGNSVRAAPPSASGGDGDAPRGNGVGEPVAAENGEPETAGAGRHADRSDR
jgi:sec-independent protein translocase protein TatB